MDEFPGIVFRDGPTGRRAALAGGPDVWEVMATLKSGKSYEEEAIAATAGILNLTNSQVQAAVRYYSAFSDEIDRRIALNNETTAMQDCLDPSQSADKMLHRGCFPTWTRTAAGLG